MSESPVNRRASEAVKGLLSLALAFVCVAAASALEPVTVRFTVRSSADASELKLYRVNKISETLVEQVELQEGVSTYTIQDWLAASDPSGAIYELRWVDPEGEESVIHRGYLEPSQLDGEHLVQRAQSHDGIGGHQASLPWLDFDSESAEPVFRARSFDCLEIPVTPPEGISV